MRDASRAAASTKTVAMASSRARGGFSEASSSAARRAGAADCHRKSRGTKKEDPRMYAAAKNASGAASHQTSSGKSSGRGPSLAPSMRHCLCTKAIAPPHTR